MREIFDSFSFGIEGKLSVTYKGVTASVDAAFDKKQSNHWFSNSAGASGVTMNKQTCHTIEDSCLNGQHQELTLDPTFTSNVKMMMNNTMLSADGTDTKVLERWSEDVIAQSGTHLCTRTDNGAAIKMFTKTDMEGSSSAQCAEFKICLELKAQGTLPVSGSASLCEHNGGCSNGTSVKASYDSTCVAVGGDSTLVSDDVCQTATPVSERAQFLTSGDLDATSSVIAMDFMPLNTLLERYNYPMEVTDTMEKAIAYHLCKAQFSTGVWEWDTTGTDGGDCKCTRTCENGGTLDADTCTCTCRGDDLHGWRGDTCTETYGFCQPGTNTGNRAAAEKCTVDNFCSSAFRKNACGPTDMCCLTAFGGQCCPFEYTCDCGVGNCRCVPPVMPSTTTDRLMAAFAKIE